MERFPLHVFEKVRQRRVARSHGYQAEKTSNGVPPAQVGEVVKRRETINPGKTHDEWIGVAPQLQKELAMKTSSIVKSIAAVAVLAASSLSLAQPMAIGGGWDRLPPSGSTPPTPTPVLGGSIDITQTGGCVGSLVSISLTTDDWTNFGASFTSSPTWSKTLPVDPSSGCSHQMDDLEPFGYVDPITLNGRYRVIYNWCDAPALAFTSGSSTTGSPDWDCAQLMVVADVTLTPAFSVTPLSINLVVHGIAGSINNWMNYDVYLQ